LERAKKLSYIRSNSNSRRTGADDEVALSLADIALEDEQELEEWAEKEGVSVTCRK